jgi:hypothetical protein
LTAISSTKRSTEHFLTVDFDFLDLRLAVVDQQSALPRNTVPVTGLDREQTHAADRLHEGALAVVARSDDLRDLAVDDPQLH